MYKNLYLLDGYDQLTSDEFDDLMLEINELGIACDAWKFVGWILIDDPSDRVIFEMKYRNIILRVVNSEDIQSI